MYIHVCVYCDATVDDDIDDEIVDDTGEVESSCRSIINNSKPLKKIKGPIRIRDHDHTAEADNDHGDDRILLPRTTRSNNTPKTPTVTTTTIMDNHLRYSNHSIQDDLEQDRRLINQKLQLRRSKQQQNYEEEEDDQSVLDYYNNSGGGSTRNLYGDDYLDFDHGDDIDQEEFLLRQAHEQDEQMIGGKVVHTTTDTHSDTNTSNHHHHHEEEEGLEACNQALTTMPAAWWAKRKQWQKRRDFGSIGSVMGITSRSSGFGGGNSRGNNQGMEDSSRVEDNMMLQEEEEMMMMENDNPDHHHGGEMMEEGALGHPVLMTDPTTLGYDTDAFRQASGGNNNNGTASYTTPGSSSNLSNPKQKRGPTILYVTRAEIKRRRAQQSAYIISACFVIFLFMFCLEQLKLAQYAMVESPVPYHAYLAGESRQQEEYDDGTTDKVTLGSLGLQQFDGNIQGIPVVEFGKIPIDRDDPLAQQIQTETATGGGVTTDEEQQQSAGILHGADYFEILKGVITGWGITPADIFANELSPQYKALHWMAYEDILRRQPDTDYHTKKIIQRYALSVIYFATAGELWRDSALFLSNLDECSWNIKREPKYFLGAGDCEEGFVTRLDLWGNQLTVSGVLLVIICNALLSSTRSFGLTEQTLSLSISLQGALPPEIGSLNSLKSISVFDNNMRGPPPKSIVHLKKLEKLFLQKNDFQGDLDFLCVNEMKLFKSDCGKRGGVNCSCCTGCGYNANNDKPIG